MKDLNVRPEPRPFIRCEQTRSTRYAPGWEAAHPNKRCMREARYEHEGKRYCALHAGQIALALMLKAEAAVRP